MRKVLRLSSNGSRRAWGFFGALALFAFLAAGALDSFYWSSQLKPEAVERALARYEKTGEARSVAYAANLSDANFKDRMLAAADEYLRSTGRVASAEKTVDDGLAFWGVGENVGVGAAFDFAKLRTADAQASFEAAEAFAELDASPQDEPDGGLDAALAFLSELDPDLDGGRSGAAEALAWSFAPESGNPLDSFGAVKRDDFGPSAVVEAAARAFSASARLFFLLTLGGLLGGLRGETPVDSVFGLARAARALRALLDRALSASARLTEPFAFFRFLFSSLRFRASFPAAVSSTRLLI
ncbi:MAG: hypothetical protein IIU43_02490 [Thermoguttaceae bacterium]|nr:hypothetical protein [Thermoguttaceae bacterium]